jgi:hypothetical protein
MRHDLNTMRASHQRRAVNQTVVRAGAANFAQTAQKANSETLNTTQDGTAYPVFILGLHDPDDPETPRWIP